MFALALFFFCAPRKNAKRCAREKAEAQGVADREKADDPLRGEIKDRRAVYVVVHILRIIAATLARSSKCSAEMQQFMMMKLINDDKPPAQFLNIFEILDFRSNIIL